MYLVYVVFAISCFHIDFDADKITILFLVCFEGVKVVALMDPLSHRHALDSANYEVFRHVSVPAQPIVSIGAQNYAHWLAHALIGAGHNITLRLEGSKRLSVRLACIFLGMTKYEGQLKGNASSRCASNHG